MSETCVIEINDAGITLADAAGVHVTSPGYAVLTGRGLLFGDAARARARLNPRQTFDRFWEHLDQQPLTRAAGPAQSHADLAYFHLRELWTAYDREREAALLAVPSDYESEQLSLLLGIVQACEIPVVGLVSAPVAAAATVAGARPRLFLQAHLHRVQAVRVEGGDGLTLGPSRTPARRGLAELDDAWAAAIAQVFVRDTRFDPLHDARTEQSLYDRLPEWLAALAAAGHTRVELGSGLRNHHVDIDRGRLAEAAASVYAAVADEAAAAGEVQVLVDHRLAALPGLLDRLTAACAVPPMRLPRDGVTRAALAHAAAIRSDASAPDYVTHLPGEMTGAALPPPDDGVLPAASAEPLPTHVLHGWRAYPVGPGPLTLPLAGSPAGRLVRRNGGLYLQADTGEVRVNGAAVNGEVRLAAGDRVDVGGETMWLIVAVACHGTS